LTSQQLLVVFQKHLRDVIRLPQLGLFTPGGQIGYMMDHTGCHQLHVFWMALPGVRLV
jgi:hypothetical protein